MKRVEEKIEEMVEREVEKQLPELLSTTIAEFKSLLMTEFEKLVNDSRSQHDGDLNQSQSVLNETIVDMFSNFTDEVQTEMERTRESILGTSNMTMSQLSKNIREQIEQRFHDQNATLYAKTSANGLTLKRVEKEIEITREKIRERSKVMALNSPGSSIIWEGGRRFYLLLGEKTDFSTGKSECAKIGCILNEFGRRSSEAKAVKDVLKRRLQSDTYYYFGGRPQNGYFKLLSNGGYIPEGIGGPVRHTNDSRECMFTETGSGETVVGGCLDQDFIVCECPS